MKFVIDDKIPFICGLAERLADEVVYLPGGIISPADVRDADALIVRTRTLCNRRLLEGSRVRFIATATIGYDHIDTDYLSEAGIEWTNCPGCNATSVAQYVRNALLEAEQNGLIALSEATLGFIGFGHVGTAVYETMMPYVKKILVNDPPLFELHSQLSILQSPLSTIYETSDIITLHTPLTFEGSYPTHHLIDGKSMRKLKRNPIIINAARGGVVDEDALLRAMDEGLVRQTIIDTWESEPDINLELLQRAFIATPHIAGYSADGKANATRMVLNALSIWMGRDLTFDIRPPQALPSRTGLQYSPLEDSARLKANPEGFEQQRGDYPLRRE